jgi:ankyrin repeat protein
MKLAAALIGLALLVGPAGAAPAAKPAPKGDALFVAAEKAQLAVVQKFLAGGGDVNAADKQKLTLLNWAAYGGAFEVAKLLIDKGADVNAHLSEKAWTPLMNASAMGFPLIANALIEHGAQVNALDSDGYSALAFAAEKKRADIVRILLAHGADGGNALVQMARTGQIDALNLLVESGIDANATPRTDEMWFTPGETALYMAAGANVADVAAALLSKGANPNIATPKGGNMPTPLMMAAYHCNGAMIDALIAHNVNRGATNGGGETAADLAATGWTSDMKPCAAEIVAKLR